MAVSTRLSRVDFYGMSGTLDETLDYISKNNLYYFEPAILLRFGFENVKLQAQLIYSDLLNNASCYISEDFQFSVGLHITLNANQKPAHDEASLK